MSELEYSAISGQMAAGHDIAKGIVGYHRNISNSPSYRSAYDSAIAAWSRGISGKVSS